MRDLTTGSIPRHIVHMSLPIAVGMLFQTLYYLVDLYFVAALGDAALAGVGAAGNAQFIVMAGTQILGAGTMALIAHASGRKDREDARLLFNQGMILGLVCAGITLIAAYLLADGYLAGLAADSHTHEAGVTYLYWFAPALALQFPLVAMGSSLRGSGVAMPMMLIQILTVILNALLSPLLIAGWLTGVPLGVAGAGLASTISVAVGVIGMTFYVLRLDSFLAFRVDEWWPRMGIWRRILKIGLPPGGEFALMFLTMSLIYVLIADFGPAAQAGFGVGSRLMQAIFVPALAVAFGTAPVAGQNVGAGLHERVRESFRAGALIIAVIMLLLTVLCRWQPHWLVGGFTRDPAVIAVAAEYLAIIAWNFVPMGLVFTCSGLFQALGNTVPAFVSGAIRLLVFAIPAVFLMSLPGAELAWLWMISVTTATLQAGLSWWLLHREFVRRGIVTAAAEGLPDTPPP